MAAYRLRTRGLTIVEKCPFRSATVRSGSEVGAKQQIGECSGAELERQCRSVLWSTLLLATHYSFSDLYKEYEYEP